MNNVICILVDSVCWNCIHTNASRASTTPFLDTLADESVIATNLYSQGPYTDAATRSLYTGRELLNDFGYYYKLNSSPVTHYDVFHDNGFETYGIYYPYYMIGNRIKSKIDHVYYSSSFHFSSEWGGLFYYYTDRLKKNGINENEKEILYKRIELLFEVWISFYQEVQDNEDSCGLIKHAIGDFDISASLKTLKAEKVKFEKNRFGYLEDLLLSQQDHILWNLDQIDTESNIDRHFIKEKIYKKYRRLFNRIKIQNLTSNLIHNRPSFRKSLSGLIKVVKNRDKKDARYFLNFLHCIFAPSKMMRLSMKPGWQRLPSASTQLNFAAEILKERKSDKPFYLSVHVLDPHELLNFYSYDSSDENLISEEMSVIESFLDECGGNFRGSLPYLLSIRYVDHCVQKFCNRLKGMGLYDQTTIMLVADHGSAFSYYPIRDEGVNSFNEECYHIPMMIRVPNGHKTVVTSFQSSRDVFPTLFDICGILKSPYMTGKSMIDPESITRKYVLTEYMGPGCPDMLSRRIWFSVRGKEYLVAYKVGVFENFDDGELCQVNDLIKDPLGTIDIKDLISREAISDYLGEIRKRFEQIKKDIEECYEP